MFVLFQISAGVSPARSAIPKQPPPKTKNSVVGVQRRNTFGVGDGSNTGTKTPSVDRTTNKTATAPGVGNTELRQR